MEKLHSLVILLVFICCAYHAQGQLTTGGTTFSQDSTSTDTTSFIVTKADIGKHRSYETFELDTLIGNVVLTQDSLVMYCDLAEVRDRINAKAYYNVVIIHQDTIQIFADSLIYDGRDKVAELFGEVILQDGDRRLYTDRLLYDVDEKTATYNTGGTLIQGIDTIISKSGYYEQRRRQVTLHGNVWYRDTSRTMLTDSILYLYDQDQLNILVPTNINQDSIEIYCESGIYRLKDDRGILSGNVQVKSNEQFISSGLLDIKGEEGIYSFFFDPYLEDGDGTATGDTIRYFKNDGYLDIISRAVYRSSTEVLKAPLIRYIEATERYETLGRAIVDTDDNYVEADNIASGDKGSTRLKGNIKLVDKESGITIFGDDGIKSDTEMKVYNSVYGQPMLLYPMSSDTLLLKADSLYSIEASEEDSIPPSFSAQNTVRWKNGETSGASRDFIFDQQDSIITMTGDPVIWSDKTQLSAAVIQIYLRNNEVYKITLIDSAFIISPDENDNYNQIKGATIHNYIKDQRIHRSVVEGNAEIHYLILQEEEYRGINLSKSQTISLTFGEDNDISRVTMDGQPESSLYEYEETMDITSFYLDGFRWRIEERPTETIFAQYTIQ